MSKNIETPVLYKLAARYHRCKEENTLVKKSPIQESGLSREWQAIFHPESSLPKRPRVSTTSPQKNSNPLWSPIPRTPLSPPVSSHQPNKRYGALLGGTDLKTLLELLLRCSSMWPNNSFEREQPRAFGYLVPMRQAALAIVHGK